MKYITETRRMNLKDFTIRDSFLKTMPSEKKMEKCRNYFKENGVLDREIIIHNGVLVDGYVGYLVLRENAVEEWDIEVATGALPLKTYVYGKHTPNGKEFVWKAKNQIAAKIQRGDRVCVNTSKGNKVVTVTRVERRYKPPIGLPIKTAYKICNNQNATFVRQLQSGDTYHFDCKNNNSIKVGQLIYDKKLIVTQVFYNPHPWWKFWEKKSIKSFCAKVL